MPDKDDDSPVDGECEESVQSGDQQQQASCWTQESQVTLHFTRCFESSQWDHRDVLMGVFLNIFEEQARKIFGKTSIVTRIENIFLTSSLDILMKGQLVLKGMVENKSQSTRLLSIFAQNNGLKWSSFATGTLRNLRDYDCRVFVNLDAVSNEISDTYLKQEQFYALLNSRGKCTFLEAITRAWIGKNQCLAEINFESGETNFESGGNSFGSEKIDLQLGKIDRKLRFLVAAVQVLIAACPKFERVKSIAKLDVIYTGYPRVFAYAVYDEDTNLGSISVFDPEGDTVCEFAGIEIILSSHESKELTIASRVDMSVFSSRPNVTTMNVQTSSQIRKVEESLQARNSVTHHTSIEQICDIIEGLIRDMNDFKPDRIINRDKTFAAHGIDSLRVMAFQNKLHAILEDGIELSPMAVFQFPTIHLLAKHLYELLQTDSKIDSKIDSKSVSVVNHLSPLPLSEAQKRLAFLHDFEGSQSHQYNEIILLEISSRTNIDSLRSTINAIVMRQNSLRTVISGDRAIVFSGTECYQYLKSSCLSFRIRAEFNYHFELSLKPAFRVMLIQKESNFLLSIVQHHIITDGWSAAILVNEISEIYERFINFQSLYLSPIMANYFDFILWEAQVAKHRFDTQIRYWKEKLNGLEAQEMPIDKPRPVSQTFAGRLAHFIINRKLSQKIKDIAKKLNATLFTVLLSLFKLLLYQNSGLTDLTVGIPIANRQSAKFERTIGLFLNTLVLRTQLGEGTFVQIVECVGETLKEALVNQDIPFETLLEELPVQRNPSISPLFQVMFVMDDEKSFEKASKRTLTATPVDFQVEVAKFDQTWYLIEKGDDTLSLNIEYNTDLFYAESIAKTVQQYALIIDQACDLIKCTTLNYRNFHIVSEFDRKKVFEKNDGNRADFPRHQTINELLRNQNAKSSPSSIAVTYRSEQWTYAHLSKTTNQVARYIQQKQIQHFGNQTPPGQPVALFINRCFEMLMGILAILKAGCAFVTLSVQFPLQRRRSVLEELGNPLLLSSMEMEATPGVPSMYLDSSSVFEYYSIKDLKIITSPANVAYITYTSGTTGKPKGVCTNHQGMSNLIANYNRLFYLQSTSIIYQVVNYGFDISCADIFEALFNGSQLVLAKDRTPTLSEITLNQVTHAYMMPAFLAHLREDQLLELSELELLAVGGETLQKSVLDFLISRGFRLVQQFGVTEQTVFSAGQTMKLLDSPTSIGGTYINQTNYVLDDYLNIVRPGRKAIMHFGGIGLSRGYYGRRELMGEKLISNPFKRNHVDFDNAIIFNLGDLVSQMSFDSPLVYNGRRDFQVKIRGMTVELGEIEQVIVASGSVKSCIVQPLKHPTTGTYLVAYITPTTIAQENNSINTEALIMQIKKQLPDYMVPKHVIKMKSFPLNSNGKVDRYALPHPKEDTTPDSGPVPPRNDIEQMIHDAWADVLRATHIGVHDCFFKSGGNSLKAMQIINRINRITSSNLTVKAIFEHKTIEQLAKFMLRSEEHESQILPCSKLNPLILSYSQNRLWFMYQFENTESHNYNICLSVNMKGFINHRSLHIALNEICLKQSLLRTVIAQNECNTAEQSVLSATESYLMLRVGQWQLCAEKRSRECSHSFNLTQRPPIRVLSSQRESSNNLNILFVMHHIITDGWSMSLMAKELSSCYNAYIRSSKKKPCKLDIHYADYSAWQHNYIQEAAMQNQLQFWKENLLDYNDLQLPTDMKRAGVKQTAGRTLSFTLCDRKLYNELLELARETESSLYIILLTAYASLMHLLSEQECIVIGSPIANRNRVEIENLIGFFVNTIVMKIKIQNIPFRQLIASVKEVALNAYRHQDVPFEYLVDELKVARDLSRSPIFQVMFILQNASTTALPEMKGVTTTVDDIYSDSAKFDWTWSLAEKENGLSGTLEYNTSLFYAETCTKAVQQYLMILETMCNESNASVSYNDFLPSLQKREIIEKLRTRETSDVPKNRAIYSVISAQAGKTPNNVVFRSLKETITCKQLEDFTSSVGSLIKQRLLQLTGVGMASDFPIAVCCEQSVELYAGLVTAQAIGGCYVPLDPKYPQERISYTLMNSNARIVVSNFDFPEDFSRRNEFSIVDLRRRKEINAYKKRKFKLISSSVNLAYIIYTSGTTGKPKGVCIKQKSLMTNIRFSTYNYFFAADYVFFTFAKCVFDACIPFLFGCVMNGAQYCVRDESLTPYQSPMSFAPIALLFLTPAITSSFSKREIENLSKYVDMWTGGGSTIETKALDIILDFGIVYLQRYGPTEVTVYQTMTTMKRNSHFPTKIGPPIDNISAYVVSRYNHLVSVCKPGELLMSGNMVAAGYLKSPDLTDKAFFINPFNSRENTIKCLNTRIYRSGDFVTVTPVGEIIYGGRRDSQIKVRGYRIELGEVEAVISKHPDVQASVAVAYSENESSQIIAYCIPSKNAPNDKMNANCLRAYLKQKLPEFMIPQKIVFMDSFPTNFSGKIDRQALPKVDFSHSETATRSIKLPRNELEKTIHKIWCAVLSRDSISIDDDFFQIGGHSLKATQVVSRLEAMLRVDCELRSIFLYPTIALLAEFISGTTLPNTEFKMIATISKTKHLPLSFMQNRLLFQSTYDRETLATGADIAYNTSLALEIAGLCNMRAFQYAFSCVTVRQASLRTVFYAGTSNASPPFQTILSGTETYVCLSPYSSSSSTLSHHTLKRNSLTKFALEKKAPTMIQMIYSQNKIVLSIVLHHIITDGWSNQVLAEELSDHYNSFVNCSINSNFPPKLPIQYVDYVPWHTAYVEMAKTELSEYWKTKLRGYEDLQLATDMLKSDSLSFWGSSVPFSFPTLNSLVQNVCDLYNVTPYMVMLAAFKMLMSRYSVGSQTDITVGSPVANRSHESVEKLIGFFVNSLVMRTNIKTNGGVNEILSNVKETALEALKHQNLPFEYLIELLNVQRSLSVSPIFQVMFVLQNTKQANLNSLHGATINVLDVPLSVTKFDLTLFVYQNGVNLEGSLEYLTSIFYHETAERMVHQWSILLRNFCATLCSLNAISNTIPFLQPSAISYQTTLQISDNHYSNRLIRSDYPKANTVYDTFERQMLITPKRILAELEDRAIDYGAMNDRAKTLEFHLNQNFLQATCQSITADSVIAICSEKNFDMIACILAVYKSGAAYLPLDRSQPIDRIQFMISETGASVCLGSQLPEGVEMPTIDSTKFDSMPVGKRKRHGAVNTENDLAYIIYTSGTTGQPKGTAVYQRSISNMICQGCNIFFSNETDKVYQFTNYIFDNSVLEFFMAIFHGGALVLNQGKVDARAILNKIRQHSITHILLFPGIVSTFSKKELLELLALRYWIMGAEKANPEVLNFCLSEGITVVQNFGPTETTAYALWRRMKKLDDPANLGTEIGNACASILGQNGAVSFGIPRQCYIMGEGVARGYVKRCEITRQRFFTNSDLTKEDEIKGTNLRLYDTGDIVKARQDGSILYVGRSDFQIKIRGFRVELTEVEQVLLLHKSVLQCIVQSFQETKVSLLCIAAYYVLESGADVTENELREFLSRRLPEYMIPTYFVQMDVIPLTANTKVDRDKLPKPEKQQDSKNSQRILPRNAIEWIIHNAWTEALEIESVSVREDFFKIGGHSLIAGKVCSRISAALGKECKIKWLFENSTIESLARVMQTSNMSARKPKFVKIDKTLPIKLSFGQEQMWFLHQHREDASFLYNLPFVQEFDDRLNTRAVHVSLMSFIQRQCSFRTTFVQKDLSDPQQIILSATESYIAPYQIIINDFDLSPLLRANYFCHLDIARKPAIKSYFYHTAADSLIFEMILHHIISDAWSTRLMAFEMGEYYSSFFKREQPFFEPLTYQYADFAYWQREYLQGVALKTMLSYWQEKLTKYTETQLNLETDAPRPAVSSRKSGKIEFAFEKSLQNALRAYCRRSSSTIYMVILGALGLLLNKLSGKNKLLIGSPTANRTQRETENIYGYFLNNLVMNLHFEREEKVANYMSEVKRTVLDAYEHQELPFELLVSTLRFSRELNNQPLFQVYFNCRYNLEDPRNVGIVHAKITEVSASDIGMFDLDLDVDEGYHGLTGQLMYNSEIFYHQRMLNTVQQLKFVLHQLVCESHDEIALNRNETTLSRNEITLSRNEITLSRVRCMPEGQKHAVLQFNESEDFPNLHTISSIFCAQSRKTPKNIQIRYLDQKISYNEVEFMTSQIAACVKQTLVARYGETHKPDSIVALCLERKLNLPIVLQACFKAGCAYTPISSEYPLEKRKFLIENSKSALILINSKDDISGSECDYNVGIINVDREEIFCHYRIKKLRDLKRWDLRANVDLACLMYTSGSTGLSKGVALRQEQLITFLKCSTQKTPYREGGVMYNFCTYVFDNSINEYFGAFVNGATSLIPTTNLETVETLLKESLLNYVFLPPTFTQTIDEKRGKMLGDRVESVEFGGEALNETIFQRVLNWGAKIFVTYGPTEAAVDNTYRSMKYLDNCMNNGRPRTNSQISIIDIEGQHVPVGTAGEIVISGPTARGYLNVTPRVAASFYPNPCRTTEQIVKGLFCKAYKVGDYAKWLPDGQIIFIGRIDSQIKLRGMRIELEEVESTILEFPRISGAAVTVLQDSQGRAQGLVGYYVTDEENIHSELVHFLKQKLPPHMVPVFNVKINRILTTISGKVNRRALSEYFESVRDQMLSMTERESMKEEMSEIEKLIAAVWSECLEHSKIGPNDNFFDVGGNSLLTVKLRSLLEVRLKVFVRIADIFKYQTVRTLATFISDQLQNDFENTLSSKVDVVVPIGQRTNFPLDVFFFHPLVGGAIFPYQHLIAQIRARCNFYGIQHPNTFELEPAHQQNSLRELVSFYLNEINTKRNEMPKKATVRPFVMIGSSLGGILAQEAAAQLESQGQSLPFIICIDSAVNAGDDSNWSRSQHDDQMRSIFAHYDIEISDAVQKAMIENAWQLLGISSHHTITKITATQMYLFRVEENNGTGVDYGWGKDCEKAVFIDYIPGRHSDMLFANRCAKMAVKITAILKEYDSI